MKYRKLLTSDKNICMLIADCKNRHVLLYMYVESNLQSVKCYCISVFSSSSLMKLYRIELHRIKREKSEKIEW